MEPARAERHGAPKGRAGGSERVKSNRHINLQGVLQRTRARCKGGGGNRTRETRNVHLNSATDRPLLSLQESAGELLPPKN